VILLILDLDETLMYADETGIGRPEDFSIDGYAVYKRPGLDTFIDTIRPHFELAVWTSSTRPYAEAVVPRLFPPDLPLRFVWARDRCTMRFDPERHDYVWAKNLSKLKRLGYRLERVLIVDDSPEKLEKNYGNLVRVRPFEGDPHDRELEALGEYLSSLRETNDVRRIEKRFWRRVSTSQRGG
jgi:carboxy-terminal domain RNA polymerase II polypeptide A small phosphatase